MKGSTIFNIGLSLVFFAIAVAVLSSGPVSLFTTSCLMAGFSYMALGAGIFLFGSKSNAPR